MSNITSMISYFLCVHYISTTIFSSFSHVLVYSTYTITLGDKKSRITFSQFFVKSKAYGLISHRVRSGKEDSPYGQSTLMPKRYSTNATWCSFVEFPVTKRLSYCCDILWDSRVCTVSHVPAETHVFFPQKETEMSPDSNALEAAKIPVENCVTVSL